MHTKIAAAAACCLSLFVSPAVAVDFSKVLANEEGKPLCLIVAKDGERCPDDKVATIGRIVRSALYVNYPDEQNVSGDEKYKRAELAQAITGASDVKLKVEDIALMKRLVAKLYSPLVVYQTWRELDPPQN